MKAEFDRTIQDLAEDVTIPNFSTLSSNNFSEDGEIAPQKRYEFG